MMITKTRRRIMSPTSARPYYEDNMVQIALENFAVGQPLLTDDIKPAVLDDEYSGNFANSTSTTSTLTPTTLRNIGEAFDYQNGVEPPLDHELSAGFAPPSVIVSQPFNNSRIHDESKIKEELIEEDAGWVPTPWVLQAPGQPHPQPLVQESIYQANTPYTTVSEIGTILPSTSVSAIASNPRKRNQTSSPPTHRDINRKRVKDEKGPPEEEEKKKQRRERNKQAAARCRQRRVDQTNELQIEVDALEATQKSLVNEMNDLRKLKKQLEDRLSQHNCVQGQRTTITSESMQMPPMTSASGLPVAVSQAVVSSPSQVNVIVRKDSVDSRLAEICSVPTSNAAMPQQSEKRERPTTLNMNIFDQTGVAIQTPSVGLYSFESFAEGTGLTPTLATPIAFSPSCNVQQRNSAGDVVTPDTTSRKLVTL